MPISPETLERIGTVLKKHNLDEPDPKKEVKAPDSVFINGFKEIGEFYKQHQRLPVKGKNISERKLASRLKSIVEDEEKRAFFLSEGRDPDGIISLYCESTGIKLTDQSSPEQEEAPVQVPAAKVNIPESLKGIAGSNAFAKLMGNEEKDSSLFGGRFAKKPKKEQVMPDYVAKRKDCADFEKFQPFFDKCLADLKIGARKAIPFKNEQHIEEGKFYVLGGLLCYVAEKGKEYVHKGKKNTRLRLIFVNGRESDMLLRSLSTELYKSGFMLTEHEDQLFPDNKISPDDTETGWLYVLRSLSENIEVKTIPHLHKIGFTKKTVEERIKGAEKQVTYLMAPVEIIATAKTANVSAQAFEQLIHAVFGQARLDIEIKDTDGEIKQATEWFSIPWPVIEQAVQLISQGQIEYYLYDPEKKELVFRS